MSSCPCFRLLVEAITENYVPRALARLMGAYSVSSLTLKAIRDVPNPPVTAGEAVIQQCPFCPAAEMTKPTTFALDPNFTYSAYGVVGIVQTKLKPPSPQFSRMSLCSFWDETHGVSIVCAPFY